MKNPSHRAGVKAVAAQLHRVNHFVEPLEPRTFLSAVPSGTIDPTFGKGGSALFTADRSLDIKTVAAVALPKGKILLLGTNFIANGIDVFTTAIERLNADGSPDKTFGKNGIRLFAASTGQPFTDPRAIAVDSAGRIYVAGHAGLARLKSNGSLDKSFSNSFAKNSAAGYFNSIAIQTDGNILLGGYYPEASSRGADDGQHNFAVTRIHPNGNVDEQFGDHGRTVVKFSIGLSRLNSADYALTIDTQGRILAAGGDDGEFDLVRLSRDGLPDSSFGDHGKAVVLRNEGGNSEDASRRTGAPSFVKVSQRATDGEIIAAGGYPSDNFIDRKNYNLGPLVVAAFQPDGMRDMAFADHGVVRLEVGQAPGPYHTLVPRGAAATGIAFLRNNQTLISGSLISDSGLSGILLTRLNADGSPDASFAPTLQTAPGSTSSGGLRFIPTVSPDASILNAGLIAVKHDQFLLPIAGSPIYSSYARFGSLRLNYDGSIDRTYGRAGIGRVSINYPDQQTPVRLVATPDGKSYLTLQGDTQVRVVALKANGRVDSSFILENKPGASNNHTRSQVPLNVGQILIAIQPDGKRLVEDLRLNEGVDLIRYNVDGSIDTLFGIAGVIHFGTLYGTYNLDKILIRADGSLVLSMGYSGAVVYGVVTETIYSLTAAGGISASLELPEQKYIGGLTTYSDMVLDATGALLLASNLPKPTNSLFTASPVITRMDAVHLTVDTSYGVGGHVDLPTVPSALTLMADGRALIFSDNPSGNVNSALPSLTAISVTGTIDTHFTQGASRSPTGLNFAVSGDLMTLQNGKTLLVVRDNYRNPARAARFLPDGSLDTTFGTTGLVTLPAGTTAFTLQTTNGIESLLVAGSIKPARTSPYDTAQSESTAFVQRIVL